MPCVTLRSQRRICEEARTCDGMFSRFLGSDWAKVAARALQKLRVSTNTYLLLQHVGDRPPSLRSLTPPYGHGHALRNPQPPLKAVGSLGVM